MPSPERRPRTGHSACVAAPGCCRVGRFLTARAWHRPRLVRRSGFPYLRSGRATAMGKKETEQSGSEVWRDRTTIWVIGLLFVATTFICFDRDGGRGAAIFFGLFVSGLVMYPILVLLGKLAAWGIGRWKPLGSGARNAITLAPALIFLTLMAQDA